MSNRRGHTNSGNMPMPVAGSELRVVTERSDDIMTAPGELPAKTQMPLDRRQDSAPGEPVRVREIHDDDMIDEGMSGGFASVNGSEIKERNKLVWAVVIVMTILCIAVGICSSVLTGYFMRRGVTPPTINTENKQSVAAVVAARKPAIAEIIVGNLQDVRGSGVCMRYDKGYVYVLTNKHMLGSNMKVRFMGDDGGSDNVEVVGYSTKYDIALLKVRHGEVYVLDTPEIFRRDLEYNEGDYTVAIGNAMGMGISSYDGIISKTSDIITSNGVSVPVLRTTSAINAGMSGGALFDMEGCFIGLNTYRMAVSPVGDGSDDPSDDVEDTGFVTPVSIVYNVYTHILNYGTGGEINGMVDIEYYLPTVSTDPTLSTNTAVGSMTVSGSGFAFSAAICGGLMTVTRIDTVSPVEGMQKDDVIIKIGKTDLCPEGKDKFDLCRTAGELLRFRKNAVEGEKLTLLVRRGENTVTLEIKEYYGYVR